MKRTYVLTMYHPRFHSRYYVDQTRNGHQFVSFTTDPTKAKEFGPDDAIQWLDTYRPVFESLEIKER